jgi:hypothetical protein
MTCACMKLKIQNVSWNYVGKNLGQRPARRPVSLPDETAEPLASTKKKAEALALAAFCPLPFLLIPLPQQERRRHPPTSRHDCRSHGSAAGVLAGARVQGRGAPSCSPSRVVRTTEGVRCGCCTPATRTRRRWCGPVRDRPSLHLLHRRLPPALYLRRPTLSLRHRWTWRPHHLVLVVPLLDAGEGALSFPRHLTWCRPTAAAGRPGGLLSRPRREQGRGRRRWDTSLPDLAGSARRLKRIHLA